MPKALKPSPSALFGVVAKQGEAPLTPPYALGENTKRGDWDDLGEYHARQKNTEALAMSVGSVAVQLQYGLYVVGHLSKLAFHFMFKVVRLVVVVSSVRLACNVLQLQEIGGSVVK